MASRPLMCRLGFHDWIRVRLFTAHTVLHRTQRCVRCGRQRTQRTTEGIAPMMVDCALCAQEPCHEA